MRKSAYALALILILVPLSGCAGSDGEVNIDLTTEEIQDLIDDNIDEFLNNTTVTVVNNYNNSTIQQSSVLKSSSGTMTGTASVDNYPIGASVLVRGDRYAAATAGNSAAGLDGANICVGIGTELEQELSDWFSGENISFTAAPIADNAEGAAKFIDGSCDAMVFSTVAEAQEKKNQFDNDGSMNGVAIWISQLFQGTSDDIALVGNSLSIIITQSSSERISELTYLLAQVKLFATCPENSTDCNNIEQTLEFSTFDYTMETTCSHNVSFSWAASMMVGHQTPSFRGHGLDCSHSLNVHVSQMMENLEGYEPGIHELTWGDWVYSVVWETTSIE